MAEIATQTTYVQPTRCHIRHALDLIAASGLNVEEVIRDLGLAENALASAPDGELPLADFFRIRSYISARVRDETCNLSARQLLPGSTDFVMSHLPPEGSLSDVMEIVARSYNLLHGGEYNRVERTENEVVFCIDDRNFPYTVKADPEAVYFATESILLFLHALLTIVAPQQALSGLSRLSVRRLVSDHAPHLDFWSVPIKYGTYQYEVAYKELQAGIAVHFPPPAHLTSEVIDLQIRKLIENGLGSMMELTGSFTESVKDLIGRGMIEQSSAAASLGISPATLRRRLVEEGVTFRNLRREVLDGSAKKLIGEGLPLTAISDRLGFSDVRSFNRAFKTWNGMTPKVFQEQLELRGQNATMPDEQR